MILKGYGFNQTVVNSHPEFSVRFPVKPPLHPFPLLLKLELILIIITLLGELSSITSPSLPPPSVPSIVSILVFGLLGWVLPRGAVFYKVTYVGAEFGLITLAALLDSAGISFFPGLYAIVIMRSFLIFQALGRLVVAGIAFISMLMLVFLRMRSLMVPLLLGQGLAPMKRFPLPPPDQLQTMSPDQIRGLVLSLSLNIVFSFGLMLTFVFLLVNALISERQSREKLSIAHDQLRQYALRIENQAALQERNRIARDIHDSLGHTLTALNLQLEGSLKFWHPDPGRSHQFLSEAKRLGSTALQEIRYSVTALRADPLRSKSLEEAIGDLIGTFQQDTGIHPTVLFSLPADPHRETSITLFRIVQEALTNIRRHAHATAVTVSIGTEPDGVRLEIGDDGRGFEPSQNTTGYGIQGMQERAVAIGGKFEIHSQPGQGCLIRVRLPLEVRMP